MLGVMMSWQYKSIKDNRVLAQFETKRASELQSELLREKNKNEELSKRLEDLQKINNTFVSSQGETSKISALLKEELDRTKIIAGLVSVKGSGIILSIADDEVFDVSDSNILYVLNELRASDVQAISVNNERIIATSEVRKAGNYIMINGRQMVSPFVIKAIADPLKLEHALRIMDGAVERLQNIYYLNVDLKQSDNIIIPSVRDDGTVIKIDMLTPID